MEPIGGHNPMVNNTGDILHIETVPEKRVSGRRYDQSLDLGEFDIFESVLKAGRDKVVRPFHLERVEIWQEF